LSLIVGLLIFSGIAFAHGTEKHGITVQADAQMKKLHDMMPIFSLASAALEAALEKGDVVVVETEVGKIIAAIPDLKISKPHKNIKQQKKFVAFAATLEETVASTAVLAKQGDFAGAKAAFKNAEKTCAACHAKFRD
jgi:soluble cytochrome b562